MVIFHIYTSLYSSPNALVWSPVRSAWSLNLPILQTRKMEPRVSCSRSYIVLKGRQNLLILINILFLLDLDDFLDFFFSVSEIFKPLDQPVNPFLNSPPATTPYTPLFWAGAESPMLCSFLIPTPILQGRWGRVGMDQGGRHDSWTACYFKTTFNG